MLIGLWNVRVDAEKHCKDSVIGCLPGKDYVVQADTDLEARDLAILLHWNTHPGIVTRDYVVNRKIIKVQEQDEWTVDFFPDPETIVRFSEADDEEEERKEGLIQKKVRTEFYRLRCKVTKIE